MPCSSEQRVLCRRFEDTGHSKSAREMLKKYLRGVVPEEERRATGAASGSTSAAGDASNSSMTWIAYAIPAIAVLVAVLYQFGFLDSVLAARK